VVAFGVGVAWRGVGVGVGVAWAWAVRRCGVGVGLGLGWSRRCVGVLRRVGVCFGVGAWPIVVEIVPCPDRGRVTVAPVALEILTRKRFRSGSTLCRR